MHTENMRIESHKVAFWAPEVFCYVKDLFVGISFHFVLMLFLHSENFFNVCALLLIWHSSFLLPWAKRINILHTQREKDIRWKEGIIIMVITMSLQNLAWNDKKEKQKLRMQTRFSSSFYSFVLEMKPIFWSLICHGATARANTYLS